MSSLDLLKKMRWEWYDNDTYNQHYRFIRQAQLLSRGEPWSYANFGATLIHSNRTMSEMREIAEERIDLIPIQHFIYPHELPRLRLNR